MIYFQTAYLWIQPGNSGEQEFEVCSLLLGYSTVWSWNNEIIYLVHLDSVNISTAPPDLGIMKLYI